MNPSSDDRPGPADSPDHPLRDAHAAFIAAWGDMATTWGVPRSMAEVHALLFIDGGSFNTDQLMARLGISRGNASMTTRTLVEWGIVQRSHCKDDRRDYFRAEQDVWRLFATVIRTRKRREVDPLVALVDRCRAAASKVPQDASADARERTRDFERKLEDILRFTQLFDVLASRYLAGEADGLLDVLVSMERSP
jgi:DNA-binding transcriptional regulator GbsR (MarR family)